MREFRSTTATSAVAMLLVSAVWLAGPSGIAALDEVTTASTASPSSERSGQPQATQTTQTTMATPPVTDSENKFLKYLFNKYGSKGVISFEGLEHLMHSLGLGGLDFPHTLKEHRPEGYDFGDYDDVYNGEQSPPPHDPHQHDHHHPHHHHHRENGEEITDDGVTVEPPVITFANTIPQEAPPARRVPQEQHHHHHQDGDEGSGGGASTSVTPTQHVPRTHTSKGTTPGRAGERGTTTTTTTWPGLNEVDDDHVWQEMIFKDIHDPRHRHPRNKNVPYCLSPMSIVHLVMEEPVLAKQANLRHRRSLAHHQQLELRQDGTEDDGAIAGDSRIEITPSEFKDLCPAFLVQLDQRACTQKLQREANPRREKKPFSQAWIYASASVLIISLCGLVGVAMVPLAKSIAYDDILRFLIGLGVGTLCGDALMHLLPHALLPHGDEEHSHEAHAETDDHDHSAESRAVWLCLCCFGAAFFMYSLEMILPLFRNGNAHGHSHGPSSQSNRVDPQQPVPTGQQHHHHQSTDDIELDHGELSKEREANTMLAKKGGAKPMAAVAFMVILGDGLHNITDGLAIGAAFAIDPVMGLATSFAILCHELPHELGDFALLLQTGVSIRRAIFLNIVSSVLSFIGMALGLLLTGLHESVVSWIYAATAGTFLYIALSDLVPEMRNDLSRCDQKLKVILTQLSGLALGAVIMLLIALNEESLQRLFE